ncbi:MAG: branched-chain amino acid transporter [Clostridiales bacterium 44_9]|nr:MAG: branched-chain amino acid transporter [Clostridiales bacterium 44_9]
MQNNIFLYIAIMVGVTTLIRVLPLTLIRKEIKNVTLRSFLYYIPYVTLAVMTFPAILAAWMGKSLFFVSSAACIVVFVLELFLC